MKILVYKVLVRGLDFLYNRTPKLMHKIVHYKSGHISNLLLFEQRLILVSTPEDIETTHRSELEFKVDINKIYL